MSSEAREFKRGEMTPIGAVLGPLAARIEAARQRAAAQRAAGQPLCDACGDSGARGDGRPCHCAAGMRWAQVENHERYWRERIPFTFQAVRLETSPHRAAAERVRAWVEAEPWRHGGGTLLLTGPVGTGKTALAVGAMRIAYERFGTCPHFVNVVELLEAARPRDLDRPAPADQAPRLERVQAGSLVLLDDLGAEKPSEWVTERLYALVDARWRTAKATIVTTNVDGAELEARLGARTMSRLLSRAEVVPVTGPDLRRQGW